MTSDMSLQRQLVRRAIFLGSAATYFLEAMREPRKTPCQNLFDALCLEGKNQDLVIEFLASLRASRTAVLV